MLGAIHHIEIEASDAEEMAGFLERIGYEERRRTAHHGQSYELVPTEVDGPIVEIHTVSGEEVPGINHIAFAVDDLESVTETLREAAVDDLVGPQFIESTGRRTTNFRDPDGRRFQIVEATEEGV